MVYTDKIHLVADTVDELFQFANKIGLKREWYQNHHKHPHFDIKGRMVARAFAAGALYRDTRWIVEFFQR